MTQPCRGNQRSGYIVAIVAHPAQKLIEMPKRREQRNGRQFCVYRKDLYSVLTGLFPLEQWKPVPPLCHVSPPRAPLFISLHLRRGLTSDIITSPFGKHHHHSGPRFFEYLPSFAALQSFKSTVLFPTDLLLPRLICTLNLTDFFF